MCIDHSQSKPCGITFDTDVIKYRKWRYISQVEEKKP